MEIEYFTETRKPSDIVELYTSLGWYGLPGYTDEEIDRAAENSFYSVFAYDKRKLVGLGRVASDGKTVAVMSGICVRQDYRRRGIGEGIVSRLVYFCQSGQYCVTVQLFCEDSLKRWYERLGFERCSYGMRKPACEEKLCELQREFNNIYGIEQILEHIPDFYWYNFDSFGEFRFYASKNQSGEDIPNLHMTFYVNEPKALSCELIFDNVQNFEIGVKGLRTPLQALGIVKAGENYRVCSLEDDDINFYCENFRVINAQVI
ncbi:MAG: GNAT family N-acetyltransferase [Ruminococcus sp.]|jgi:N-acetylglutamate synthase-like GNAT family acetyltransferase|nr:GNAT family N-acetyltransferase [Ruminococcus sp.]